MSIKVLPIDFIGTGALLEPVDRKLHDAAVEYCRREIVGDVDLSKFSKCWVALNASGEVCGVTGYVTRVDVPVFRSTDGKATTKLVHRLKSFFEDNGLRGQEIFVHISSKELPEQRCEKWQESLDAVRAVPADRFSVKV